MMTKKMTPEAKAIWLEALRGDGLYSQARQAFTEKDDDGTINHCCLAVLAHEAVKKEVPGIQWAEGSDDPEIVVVWDPEDYAWDQVDDAKEVMELYPEVEYRHGSTPKANGETQWAWAKASDFNEGMLPAVVQHWAGLDSTNPKIGEKQASDWNDVEELNFDEIANKVEENL